MSGKRTRGGGRGGGWGWGDWVVGTEGAVGQDEPWVLCSMLANPTPIRKNKLKKDLVSVPCIFGIFVSALICT